MNKIMNDKHAHLLHRRQERRAAERRAVREEAYARLCKNYMVEIEKDFHIIQADDMETAEGKFRAASATSRCGFATYREYQEHFTEVMRDKVYA